jgi:hypothetical protein
MQLTKKLALRSWVFSEKPQVSLLHKNKPIFCELDILLPCSQEPATGHYSQADKSSL